MEIVKFEYYTMPALIERLREVHLRKKPHLKIFKNANIVLKENVSPDEIHFPQYYVLEKDLNEISQTRNKLLEYGIDIFHLKGFIRVFYRDEQDYQIKIFDVLPPVVEISEADGGIPLLDDGMHRIFLAREAGSAINIIQIEGVDPDYPYYALPNEKGWDNLRRCSEVPDIKKNYRIRDYKTLFRDFNTAFINVTQSRTNKKPAKLKVGGRIADNG